MSIIKLETAVPENENLPGAWLNRNNRMMKIKNVGFDESRKI
jgi:hypothetical protein